MSEPLSRLGRYLEAQSAPDPSYPQGLVDSLGEQAEEFGVLADSLINADVKEATVAIHEDFVVFHEVMHQTYIEGNWDTDPTYRDAVDHLTDSYAGLQILCFG